MKLNFRYLIDRVFVNVDEGLDAVNWIRLVQREEDV
jgi:hypothetical protein